MNPVHGVFITGTDTEVGKTRISAGVLRLLARQGIEAGGLKPVAAGMSEIEGRWINEDVQALQAASGVTLSDAEVGPVQLRTACAPHIAAALEGMTPDRAALVAHVRRMVPRAQAWVVEGVGGFCVPMSAPGARPRWGMDDLAADLHWPVVMVVGLRLGCLNHALLTAQAVRARGLTLAGWVANRVDPAMGHPDENLLSLRDGLDAPCLGDVAHLAQPGADAVAACLDARGWLTVLGWPA
jgi:dethiobiotin synthetase